MAKLVHAFDFLEKPQDYELGAVVVLFGSEWLLRNLAFAELRKLLFGDEDVPYESFEGEETEWRDVADEVDTVSLFRPQGRRLALIRDADGFVSKHRAALEKYVAQPSSHALLVMMIDSFPGNWRLYKQVTADHLAIDCRPPERSAGKNKVLDEQRIVRWISDYAKSAHGANVPRAAAQQLFEMVGPDTGRLDSELAKLSAYAGEKGKVTQQMVSDLVGGWRAKTAWEMIDLALEGNAAAALDQLNRLIAAGENAVGLLAQMAWSFRQMAAATRVFQRAERQGRPVSLRDALLAAGVRNWQSHLEKGERHLRQIGRVRGGQLYRWLLDADLALKGSHSAPDRSRWILEQLVLRLARQKA